MFLPIKADFPLSRFPILTVLVCVICIGVFVKQQNDRYEFVLAMERFCNASRSHLESIVFDRISAAEGIDNCAEIMLTIANDPGRDEADVIAELASNMRPLTGFNAADSSLYVTRMLEDEVRRYKALVPEDPDEGLAYYTGSWNPWTMITSSFAHGNWWHIISNLIFFFAFAAAVEVLIGSYWYTGFVLAESLFIGITGSLSAAAAGNHYTTLGLSGVVMGMIGLFAYLLPRGKIRCFYFFIIIFGTIAVPGWILATWFIGREIYTLFAFDDYGVINVMAHVMGGLGGYLFGIAFLSEIRKDAVHIQDDFDRYAKQRRFR